VTPKRLRAELLAYAVTLPEAYVDHPWGEDVVKVRKKVFVFLGIPDNPDYPPGMTVKLPDSNALALSQNGVKPSGYGLGDSGWVSIALSSDMAFEMLREWIDESYRAIAPKKLASGLTAHR
jgi:predicted DNA-binding protein (MmcQ/YjbR family)